MAGDTLRISIDEQGFIALRTGQNDSSPDSDLVASVWNDDYAALLAAAPEMAEALRGLAGNAGALGAFEHEIREVAGNTNWQCLRDAIARADAILAKIGAGA